jgi:hypothetical protein
VFPNNNNNNNNNNINNIVPTKANVMASQLESELDGWFQQRKGKRQ